MTELNHQEIKQRIVDILKADDNVYSQSEKGKVRSIGIGIPDQNEFKSIPTPYIRITNATRFESDKPFGVIVDNAQTSSYHTIQYNIICVAQEKDAPTVESTLDNLHKSIKECLKANVQLTDPDDDSDPKCKISFPIRTEQLPATSYKGKALDGFTIVFQVEQTT